MQSKAEQGRAEHCNAMQRYAVSPSGGIIMPLKQ